MVAHTRAVVITGAGSGLGRALAEQYARRGWSVAAVDIDRDAAEATAQAVLDARGDAIAAEADVRDLHALEMVASTVADRFGHIDAWINNAGVAASGTVDATDLDQWQAVLDIDLLGVVRGSKAAIPWLRRSGGGHIVNVASFAGIANPPGMGSYNVAKAGVISLSETLRAELADDHIHLVVACPSFFKTNLVASSRRVAGEAAPEQPTTMEKITEKLMERSKFSAEDVAAAIYRAAEREEFMVIMRPDRSRWLAKRASPEFFFRMVRKATRGFIQPRQAG
ncbi:SDR family NAD(P)-dependent oxidoreductase [Algiphilus sp.]|uniref:SDR family NAD(P)-dependent oxidoreductase n=1 Tax=Algiphilus sp. TaxID=1872431 RepID=UPI002A66E089|nr:SDR family NAD(P)-dependent oxidoreductase [Pseudomonadota bacterium]